MKFGASAVVTALTGLFSPLGPMRGQARVAWLETVGDTELEFWSSYYNLLRLLYYNNGVYDELLQRSFTVDQSAMSGQPSALQLVGLVNPTHAIVQVYVATMWPGSLEQAFPLSVPDTLDPDLIQDCVTTLFEWSNWVRRKQAYATWYAREGDVFLKVSTRPDSGTPQRVFLEMILPDYASEIELDERMFVIGIRFTVPEEIQGLDGKPQTIWNIEDWRKDRATVRYWRIEDRGLAMGPTVRLPAPDDEVAFSQMRIDFVPVVHSRFGGDGEDRGTAAIIPMLDKIIALDRMVTSLNSRLYRHNRPDYFLESQSTDRDGYVSTVTEGDITNRPDAIFDIGSDKMTELPPGKTVRDAVPNVNYQAQIEAITTQFTILKETNAPELVWYALPQSGSDVSGRALQTLLKPAISKVESARGSAEEDLLQAMRMAFSIARAWGIVPFDQLGAFEDGGMDFTFQRRDVIPLTDWEQVELRTSKTTIMQMLVTMGLSPSVAAQLAGFSEEEVATIQVEEKARGLLEKQTPAQTDAEKAAAALVTTKVVSSNGGSSQQVPDLPSPPRPTTTMGSAQ
jgi:hypothetical protein